MIVLIVLFGGLLRIVGLNQSFWLDEAAQATISTYSLFDVNWTADFQPPFFYIITHLWQKIGIHDEWFLRLPSVFFGVVTIYLSYYFFSKLFNKNVGLISALLLATAPYHIYYSQEYRMYSFFGLLAILSWIFLWEKRWVWYGITILAAVFTHYFAFLLIFSQLIFVLISKEGEWRKYVMVTALSLAPFLLWLPVLTKQLHTANNLISVWPRWKEISGIPFLKFPFLIFAKFTVGQISPEPRLFYIGAVVAIVIIFSIALIKIHHALRFKFHKKHFLLFCYFFIPLITTWLLGLFVSANAPHRLIFVLPAFYGIIAVGLQDRVILNWFQDLIQTRSRNKFGMTIGQLIILSIILFSNTLFSLTYLLNAKFHREDWRGAVAYTDNKLGKNGIALSEYVSPWAPMEWYSKKSEKYIGASTAVMITEQSIQSRFSLLRPDNVILYTYLYQLSDPNRLVEKYLSSKGYKLTEEKDFRGVGIIKVYLQ